jgi:hypothetical protein
MPAPLDDLLVADNLFPGDGRFGSIELRLQVQFPHQLLRVDLLRQAIEDIQHFLFIHGKPTRGWFPLRMGSV